MKRIGYLVCLLAASMLAHGQINTQWAFDLKSTSPTHVSASATVCNEHTGEVYIGGHFNGSVDFDPSPATASLTASDGIFLAKYDSLGTYQWAFRLNGNSGLGHIFVDDADNVHITGSFETFLDADPSPASYNLSSPSGGSSIFFAKYDPNGNLLMAKSIGSPYVITLSDAEMDEQNNIYLTGFFSDLTDFDPSPAVFNLLGTDFSAFLAKYDTLGQLVFAKKMSAPGHAASGNLLELDQKNNIYLVGGYSGSIDIDPGPGSFPVSTSATSAGFMARYDSIGNFNWGLNLDNAYESIHVTGNGKLYAIAGYAGYTDMDPSPFSVMMVPGQLEDLALLKFDTLGHFLWAKPITNSPTPENAYYLKSDHLNNIYVSGMVTGACDFDPSPTGIGAGNSNGDADIFIAKYDADGQYIWARNFGGAMEDEIQDIYLDHTFNIYCCATFRDTVNFGFPTDTIMLNSHPVGGYASVLVKYAQGDCSDFQLGIDSLGHVSCTGNGEMHYQLEGGTLPHSISWSPTVSFNDTAAYFTSPGIYSITCSDAFACELHYAYLLDAPAYTSSFDLLTNMAGSGFTPGTTSIVQLTGLNKGCIATNGSLSLVHGPEVSFVSSSIAPDLTTADTLRWDFSGMAYPGDLSVQIELLGAIPLTIGDSVCFTAIIGPVTGDADTANNTKQYCFPVVASYDPNDKQVYPQGVNANHGILNNQTMTYTVRFQNTGTADAINIHILDSLDANLDLNSVHIVGSSHYMYTEVLPGNVLKFKFPNIYLPDSTSNEPESHGYVIYEVDQLPNLPHNTVVENKAAIYFDYNDPVITNTVFNTIDQGGIVQVSNDYFCPGDSSHLTIVPHVPGFNGSWQWFEGSCTGTAAGTGADITVGPATTTSYFVKESAGTICYSNTVHVLPTYNVNQDAIICSYDSLLFGSSYIQAPGTYTVVFASQAGCDSAVNLSLYHTEIDMVVWQTGPSLMANAAPATYQWINCSTMTPITGATNQTYTAPAFGSFAVIVDQDGCTDTSACYTYMNITETGTNTGINIYPNPVSNELNIVFEKAMHADITLTDVTGKTILRQTSNNQTIKLQTAYLETGVYLLSIESGEEVTANRIIKQ